MGDRGGLREIEKTLLSAWHDDEDDDLYIYISINTDFYQFGKNLPRFPVTGSSGQFYFMYCALLR